MKPVPRLEGLVIKHRNRLWLKVDDKLYHLHSAEVESRNLKAGMRISGEIWFYDEIQKAAYGCDGAVHWGTVIVLDEQPQIQADDYCQRRGKRKKTAEE